MDIVLRNQIRGVWSDDSVLKAEIDNRVDELIVFTVQADLVQQVSDLASGPQARQEVAAAIPGEGDRVGELPRLAVDLTAQRQRRRTTLRVGPKGDEL